MIWGFLRHGRHHHHDQGSLTEWSLFLLFCADPCVAVIPMIMAAAGSGWTTVVAVVVTYEIATIATMLLLVAGARAGVRSVRSPWIDRYGHAGAGALIVSVGAAMALLGI